jgi:ribosomal protein S18 acetylase RimI-like enzyme
MTAHYFPYAGFSYSEIMRRLDTKNIFYYVALVGGNTAGFIDFEVKKNSAQILGIAVLDEHRGKGIATKLLKKAIGEIKKISTKHLRQRPCNPAGENSPIKRIDLMVSQTNPAALALYRKFGFAPKGRLGRQLWGQDILVYSKYLR